MNDTYYDLEKFEKYQRRIVSRYGIATVHAGCWLCNFYDEKLCKGCSVIHQCYAIAHRENLIDLGPFDEYCHEVCKKYGVSESHLSCYMTWYADPAHSCTNCPGRELCDRMHEEGVDCDE